MKRRTFLHLVTGAVALPAIARIARADDYPSRPIHLLVGFPAGGPTDIAARLIGQWMSERLGQPFVIDEPARRRHQYRHRSRGPRAA